MMRVYQHLGYLFRGLFVFAFIGIALGQARAEFVLKSKCEVGSDGVYLSDLVDAESGAPIPAIQIDRSPKWGAVHEFTSEDLIQLINEKAQAVKVRAKVGGKKIIVTRKGRALEADEVLEALKVELSGTPFYSDGELEMEFVREWKPLLIPDGPLELKLLTKLSYRSSQTTLRFQLSDGGLPIGSFGSYVKISLWKDVWVASKSVARGMSLPEAKLQRQRMDIIKNRRELWDGSPSDSRFWFQEFISPGRIVYARSVGVKPVVRRNGLAKAIITNGVLTVSANVKVLEDGAPGDVVRVQNISTRKELIGEVIDENTVKIRKL